LIREKKCKLSPLTQRRHNEKQEAVTEFHIDLLLASTTALIGQDED
jgi:hypothetical protein